MWKGIFSAHYLKIHINSVHKWPCEKCNRLFSLPANLKRHIKLLHDGSKNEKCNACDANFSHKTELKIHLRKTHHKHYKCEICQMSFALKGDLKKHIHQSHKEYKCESCGKPFSREKSLKAHAHLIHGADVQNLILQTCNWVFENGEVCGKRFAKIYSLDVHMQMHQDIRPFGCNFCDQTFRQKAHLKRHETTHT